MKSYALIFSVLLCFISSFLLAQTPSSHVLVIGIDGVRSDALTAASTPNLDALVSEGVYSPDALNDDITISGPGWSDILCGVRSDKHLVVDNGFSGNNYVDYPSFFQRIENTYSNVNTVSICHWAPINDYIVGTDADVIVNVGSDNEVRDCALNQLENYDPHAMFIHFDDVDYAGHSYGFSPDVPQYISSIEEADSQVGEVLSALYSRPNYAQEDWLIIVTHDHGGQGYGHGGTSLEHRNVSFIASGLTIPTQLVEKTILDIIPPPVNCLGGDGTELFFANNTNVSVLSTGYLDAVVEQDFSVEIRVRTTETNDVAVIGNKDWDSGLNPGFVFSFEYPNGPSWKVNVGDGSSRADANGSSGIDDGQWHTLSATFNLDGMMRLYTDGVFVSEEDMSGVGNLNTASGLMLGADLNGAYQYNGSLAEVRIWETLLSDEEISAWACSPVDSSHPKWSSLASYWKMDDNDDYLSNSSVSNPFLDASVNGATWQIADATILYDYSETPRLVDVPVTAMTHLNMAILPEWDLDGISWVGACAVTDVSLGTTSSCISATNFYTQEIHLSLVNPPSSGLITVNEQTFILGENNTSGLPGQGILATLTLDFLVSDGMPVDINITFLEDVGCGTSFPEFFVAPSQCSCLNDVNGDGLINVGDILHVLAEFGCTFECTADSTSDGSVNVTDLLSILTEFGQVCEN